VSFNFTGGAPIAVATQIGSGNFTTATISSSSVSISVPNGTKSFAIAWVCPIAQEPSAPVFQQFVLEATLTDGTSLNPSCILQAEQGQTATVTLSVNASLFGSPAYDDPALAIWAQNGPEVTVGYPTAGLVANEFSLSAPMGTDRVDLLVEAAEISPLDPYGFYSYLVAAKSFSGQSAPGSLDGGSTIVFGTSDATISEPITVNNIPQGYFAPSTSASVVPVGEQFGYTLNQVTGNEYQGLPASMSQPGDRYSLSTFSDNSVDIGPDLYAGCFVGEEQQFTGEGPTMVTFPPTWSFSAPNAAPLPTFDISYSGFSGQSGVGYLGSIDWSPPGDALDSYLYQVTATSSFLNGATSLQLPDLSNISGFAPDPVASDTIQWTIEALQSDAGLQFSSSSNAKEFIAGAFGEYILR
jgi:hypothetical protein